MTPATVNAIVVIGVSGSGKTTVGTAVAKQLAYEFCDADDLHSAHNIEKMSGGHPLTDEDRRPWLAAVGQRISETLARGDGVVVACSALKRSYRDILRHYEPTSFFVLLDGSEELILSRVTARTGNFMPPALLSSQFATLEPLGNEEIGVTIDVTQGSDAVVHQILRAVANGEAPPHDS